MRLTIDANPFVSRYWGEDVWHASALAFFRRCELKSVQFVAPVLLLAEIAGAVSRVRGEPHFGEVAVTRTLAVPQLKLLPLDVESAILAGRLAARHAIRGADAFYLALAMKTKSNLVTWDGELLDVSSRTRVLTPDQWLRENP